jgi:hypothetical protein
MTKTIFHHTTKGINMLDARGIPTRECPSCASTLFTIQAVFDEAYEVAQYFLDAECAMCHTRLTAPTPLDLIDG